MLGDGGPSDVPKLSVEEGLFMRTTARRYRMKTARSRGCKPTPPPGRGTRSISGPVTVSRPVDVIRG
jgi:hypothetical protein